MKSPPQDLPGDSKSTPLPLEKQRPHPRECPVQGTSPLGGQHGVCPVDCPSLGCCWGPEPVSPGVVQEPALESEPGHGPDGCAWKRPGWGVRRRHSRSEPGWGSPRRKPQPPAAQAGGPVRAGGLYSRGSSGRLGGSQGRGAWAGTETGASQGRGAHGGSEGPRGGVSGHMVSLGRLGPR